MLVGTERSRYLTVAPCPIWNELVGLSLVPSGHVSTSQKPALRLVLTGPMMTVSADWPGFEWAMRTKHRSFSLLVNVGGHSMPTANVVLERQDG